MTEALYSTRREPLLAFLKAYKRGSQWMLDHPDEAAQLAVKHAIDGKDPQRNLAIIKLRNAATMDEHTRQHGLGLVRPGAADTSRAHLPGIGADQESIRRAAAVYQLSSVQTLIGCESPRTGVS